jgi:hypothetical protein
MAKLSRRKLIAGVAAAPLVGTVVAPPKVDPLVAKVRAWLADREAADGLMHQWQRLETALYRKHGAMSTREAIRAGHAEGRQMKVLDARYRAASKKLDRRAGRLVLARAVTTEGALAKVEMGLRIQEPLDCEEFSWALIQGGFEELRQFM